MKAKDILEYQNMGLIVWEVYNPKTKETETHILDGAKKEYFWGNEDYRIERLKAYIRDRKNK